MEHYRNPNTIKGTTCVCSDQVRALADSLAICGYYVIRSRTQCLGSKTFQNNSRIAKTGQLLNTEVSHYFYFNISLRLLLFSYILLLIMMVGLMNCAMKIETMAYFYFHGDIAAQNIDIEYAYLMVLVLFGLALRQGSFVY